MRLRPEHGFSLIEVMVATAVLVTGVVSLLQLFMVAAASIASAGDMTWATVVATQKLEELRSEPWGLAASGEDRVGVYLRRWTVAPLPRDGAGTITIQVVVARPAAAPVVLATMKTRTSP